MQTNTAVKIGSAGWTIPKPHRGFFPDEGTHLTRYAHRFSAVEINSSFYRSHRPTTYQRWADSVPDDFQFSVKVPKEITHELRLCGAEEPLAKFLAEVTALGKKLGPLLIQLPPSLDFQSEVVRDFLRQFRNQFAGDIVCEPRHVSWVDLVADQLLEEFQISRVFADPPVIANRDVSSCKLIYYRLHGSPRVYYSEYTREYLADLANQIIAHQGLACRVWCIFDNTALGAAATNGLELLQLLAGTI